jgi:PAS domain S-box-containing protein
MPEEYGQRRQRHPQPGADAPAGGQEQQPGELDASSTSFELLVNAVQDYAIFMLDTTGHVVSWNAGAEHIKGYARREIIGQHFSIFHGEEDRARRHPEWELEVAARDGRYEEEGWRFRRDGTRLWAQVTITAVRDEAGQLLGFGKVTRDLTQRRRAEEELRALGERYRTLYEENPSMYLTTDGTGAIISINDFGARQLGYTPDELLGRAVLEVVHPDDRALAQTHLLEAVATPGTVRNAEFRKLRRDGSVIWVRESARAMVDEGEISILTVCEDITERVRTEEELRFLAEASRVLAGSLEWEQTLETVAALAVPRLADWCVIDLLDDSGLRRVVVVHADPDRAGLARDYQRNYPPDPDATGGVARVVRTGESERAEVTDELLQQVAVDAAHLEVLRGIGLSSLMIVPLLAAERPIGAMTLASAESGRSYDDEDLRVAELLASRAALAVDKARLYRDAQLATNARDEVLSIVSHDLRNPLNTIMMSAGLLQEQVPADRSIDVRQLDIIMRQAKNMNRMIQDLLDVARIEAGRLPVEEQREDAASLLREACQAAQPLASARNIRIETDADGGLPPVCVDRQRILQVFSNLVGNAIRFTPEGGTITLRAGRADAWVTFAVEDTGPGVDAEDLPHLFQRFYQASKTRRGGAGLGLSIAKGIVEAHGGRIDVRSTPGEGATFCFTVPAVAP